MGEDIALVYMTAGISSRFGGKIKQFVKIGPNNETLMGYSLKQALPAGFTKIVFIVGNMTEKPFKEMFGNNYKGIPVYYALQEFDSSTRERPWGTCDALCAAKDLIDCSFVVCNGDDIYGENTFKILVDHLLSSKESASVGYTLEKVMPEKGSVNRGIFEIKENYVTKITENLGIEKDKLLEVNLTLKSLCSMNIFAFTKEDLAKFSSQLEEFKEKNAGDRKVECYLPVETSSLIEKGEMKMRIYTTPDAWVGVTNPEDEETVRREISQVY